MSEGSWLAQTRKKNKSLWIIPVCVAVAAAAAVFLHNNRELLWGPKNGIHASESKIETPASVSSSSRDTLQTRIEPAAAASKAPEQSASKADAEAITQSKESVDGAGVDAAVAASSQKTASSEGAVKSVLSSIRLDEIVCRLADGKKTVVRMSLEVHFSGDKTFSRELVVKRDNLKTMVQKVMSSKTLDDIVVEILRNDIKNGLNQIVEHGKINDVEFREFRLDKVD
jgi:flagellar basal body-associated protein FliL